MTTDMEGVGCVLLPRQVGLEGLDDVMYQQARRLLTAEVNAAVEGSLEGGATEVLVLDGHGANSAYNLVPEELSDRAQYIMGAPWDKYLPGFEDVDAMFMVGQHAMAGAKQGVLDHTMSSRTWVNAYINGVRVGEIGFAAYYAGDFDVPLTFLSGDLAACKEVRELIGDDVVTVPVKYGLGRTSAICLPPKAARSAIRQGAKMAVSAREKVKPLWAKSPVEVKIELLDKATARAFLSRRNCELVDERTVRFTGDNIAKVYSDMFF